MSFYSHKKFRPRRRAGRAVFVLLLIAIAVLGGGTAVLSKKYHDRLQPLSSDKAVIMATIAPGSTNGQIADLLQAKMIIRSDWAFEWYLRTHPITGGLKAGTYALSPSESVPQIVDILSGGKIATDLVTILPGKRLDQIRAGLIKAGFSEHDADAALEPSQYKDHPVLAGKPPAASLEGYLYPDSYQKTSETTASDIVRLSLNEMYRYVTTEILQGFAQQGLTPYQGIIISSIVEQEVSNDADRPQVAQVFLKRYKIGMQLGSDVTAFYGAVVADQEPSVAYDSPYNTRLHSGLPPGPISNISASSLKAVAFPAQTDWLYFVAGDGNYKGKTYFSKTLAEHEDATRKYCSQLCQ